MSGWRGKVLIKGAGEQASAVAHRLHRCGFRVAMTELAQPTAIRRTVSFCSAVYEGETTIEGVRGAGRHLDAFSALPDGPWDHIPVVVDPQSRLVALWRPDVVVDGRILKANRDNRLTDAGLVIGLGPGLEAGRDVHYVVETHRGHHLGRIIESGSSEPDTGEPGEIGGYGSERLSRAPVDGVFETSRRIGNRIEAGAVIGRVAGVEIRSRIAGVLRGLAWPGLAVTAGQKMADVDPRGDPAFCHSLSDKSRTISGSVLEIVVAHEARDSRRHS